MAVFDLDTCLQWPVRPATPARFLECAGPMLAVGGEMKALKILLIPALLLLAAASALAYGHVEVATPAGVAVLQTTRESAALLLSGSVLLGLAGALRRLPLR